MSKQYFENNPELQSSPRELTFYYKKHQFVFKSDSGVFSKTEIDFGSRLLLQSVPNLNNESILDVGCGYGVIGIVLAKVFKNTKVTLVDVNHTALNLTINNAKLNGVENVIIKESFAYQNVSDKYDVIVTNPPIRAGKKVVLEILTKAVDYLNVGGYLMYVVKQSQGAMSLKKALLDVFSRVEMVIKDKDFMVFQAFK